MDSKRYRLVYTGRVAAGLERGTVISNLVLDVGLSQEKAAALVRAGRLVLKRFASLGDANRMAAKLERAGLVCAIEDRLANGAEGAARRGESSLLSLLSRITPVGRRA